mmetsp:Transcript_99040/g.171647  ORF Transcript_99040/g.171647 Transcript_99040/m.171647 type:complete len:167 (+) Transcript_99040:112-612(+)
MGRVSMMEDFEMDVDFANHIAMAFPDVPVAPAVMQIPPPQQVAQWSDETDYSEKYQDEVYEYRRVTVPRAMLQVLPQGRTMSEEEWRSHGITMSRGWQHYDHHAPEANVLLFRRVIGTDPKTGQIPPEMQEKVQEREHYIHQIEQMRQQRVREQARQREQPVAVLI